MKLSIPKIKLPKLPVKWSRRIGRAQLQLKVHTPEICLVGGLAGLTGAAVWACKATTHLPELVERHEDLMSEVHEAEENSVIEDDGTIIGFTPAEIRATKVKAYAQIAADYVKLYGPPVALGFASGGLIVWSHNVQQRRYLGAVAAYNGAMGAFEAYRERVREELGDEADERFRYGYKKEQLVSEVKDENGKKKKQKEDILTLDAGEPSQYARIFDESNPNWEKSPEFNMMFLRSQQTYFQNILNSRGYVFLNEVYDALGFEMTSAGALVGWMQNPESEPTNYISFGLFDYDKPMTRRFINGQEDALLLDFNVDGMIVDLLERV